MDIKYMETNRALASNETIGITTERWLLHSRASCVSFIQVLVSFFIISLL